MAPLLGAHPTIMELFPHAIGISMTVVVGELPLCTHPFRLRELALLLLFEGTKFTGRPDDVRDCRHLARPDADAYGCELRQTAQKITVS